MKTIICKCTQCRFVRASMRNKTNRIQTKEVRAATHYVRMLLKTLPIDEIEDNLLQKVSVDYYA